MFYDGAEGCAPVDELVPRFKEEQVFIIEAFLVHSFRESGRKGVVLGLSGGVDSALVAKLCADALGPQHVLAVPVPDGRGGEEVTETTEGAQGGRDGVLINTDWPALACP